MIWKYLEGWTTHELKDPALLEWVERFRADKWSAARAYWDEMRAGIALAFEKGADAIPEINPPFRAARQDVMDKGHNGST